MSKSKSKIIQAYNQSIDRYLTEMMLRYSAEVAYDISIAIKQIGMEAKQRIIATSPDGKRRGSKKYKRGWRVDFDNKKGIISCIVHQGGDNYRLTHLLENGHKNRNKKGWVNAQPHIAAVEEWAEREALKAIEKAVKG